MPNLLAWGAGAFEGNKYLDEEALKQRAQQLLQQKALEDVRHNQADEALRGREIDAQAANAKALNDYRTMVAQSEDAYRQKEAQNLERDDARAVLGVTPAGATLTPEEQQRFVQVGGIPMSLFQGHSYLPTAGDQGPTENPPQSFTFLGLQPKQQGGGYNKESGVALIDGMQGPQDIWKDPRTGQITSQRTGEDVTSRVQHYTPPANLQFVPLYDKTTGQPTGVGLGDPKSGNIKPASVPGDNVIRPVPDAADQARKLSDRNDAMTALAQLDRAITDADTNGLIGPGAGQVSSLTQILGTQDPKFNYLKSSLVLAKPQIDKAIAGTSRAAVNPQLMQQWNDVWSQNINAPALHSGVKAVQDLLTAEGAGKGSVAPAGGTSQKIGRFNVVVQ